MSKKFNAAQFAAALHYPNVEAFENARKEGLIPPPDFVFNKLLYWHQETVDETRKAQVSGICAAFGSSSKTKGGESSDS